jgi:hypothetical protein
MRHVRTLGLAVFAALALLAFPSLASAAGGIEADSYPVKYESIGATQYFGFPGLSPVECTQALMEGSASGPVGTLSTSVGMKCGGKALSMGSCKFELHPGSENTVDIGPPGCGPITGLVVSGCEISIPAQTGLPATFANVLSGGKEVVVLKISTEIKYTTKSCAYTGLAYQGEWEIKGYNSVTLVQTNTRSKDGFNGLFIAGKKSESEAEQPKFTAEKYPNPINGSLNSSSKFTFTMIGGYKVVCSSGQFSAELAKASASLPVGTTLSSCLYGESAAAVAMNSCSFTYGVSNINVFPPIVYKGTVGISCSKEGDFVELKFAGCVAKMPAQSPTSTVNYTNQGSGSTRSISVGSTTAEKLSYTYEVGGCTLFGKNHSDGSISGGSFTLRGA